jgi:hypothetical protein
MRYSPVTAVLTAKNRIRYSDAYGETIYNIVHPADVDAAHVEVVVMVKSGLSEG